MPDHDRSDDPGPGPADADPRGGGGVPPEGEIRCKLERADGSEWTVTDLELTPAGLRITAYRYVRERGPGAESRRETLEDEPFVTTDRINCMSRRGTVRWLLSSPAPDGVVL